MSKYKVTGGNPLLGEIEINGAKNAALPIMCAALINKGITVLTNVPDLADTRISIEILKHLGCKISRQKKTVIIDSTVLTVNNIPSVLSEKMRSSIIFAGALLSRLGEAETSYPGGCCLGKRPIDLHLKAFKALGAEIQENGEALKISANGLKGAVIELDFPSVGATQNSILAAVCAKGESIIKNAAKEPEITDLCLFLNKMGAKISGMGTEEIVISGVNELKSSEISYPIMPDRIEAGTFLCAVAAAKGELLLKNINPRHIMPLTAALKSAGCSITELSDSIIIKSNSRLNGIKGIETKPYPLFPTDLQPQLTAVLALSRGESFIRENIFEARNRHTAELCKMGAKIKVKNGNEFYITGVKKLNPAEVTAYDLRGGAAMIIAALSCQGESTIACAEHILRGYENIENTLGSVGAKIMFIK